MGGFGAACFIKWHCFQCSDAAQRLGLSKIERDILPVSPSPMTITFYEGSAEHATTFLRERVAAIVKANLWL